MSTQLAVSSELANFSANIALLRTRKGLSQSALAELIDTGRTTISNWEKGVSFPLFEDLVKLSKVLDTDLNTLVNPIDTKAKPKPRSVPAPAVAADSTGDQDVSTGNIIALGSRVAAGLMKHHGQQEFLAKQPRMMLPGPQFRGAGLLAIQVEGDSMDPTILDGDWLVVRQLDDPRQQVHPGQVYVVVTREGAMAKRLYLDMAGTSIVCRSDNPAHKDQRIDDDSAMVYDVLALLRDRPGDQRHGISARLLKVERDLAALKKR